MTNQIAVHRIRCFAAAAVCALAAVSLLASPASATPVGTLDQSVWPSVCCADNIGPGTTIAQTFTVGAAGVLSTVELDLYAFGTVNAPLVVQITRLNGALPDQSQVVATESVDQSALPVQVETTIDVTFSSPPSLSVGQHYAIVLTSTANPNWFWLTNASNGYAGGDSYDDTGSGFVDANLDMNFRTFMSPAPPAPPAPVAEAGPRGAYCTVAGDTTDNGLPLLPGTFVNLDDGQALTDPSYKGATPANFINGVGLTCAAPPAGYTQHGFATPDMNVDGGVYPYYSN